MKIAIGSAKRIAFGRDEEAFAGAFHSKRRSWQKRAVERIQRLEESSDFVDFGTRQRMDRLGRTALVEICAAGFDVDRPALLGRDDVGAISIACGDDAAAAHLLRSVPPQAKGGRMR